MIRIILTIALIGVFLAARNAHAVVYEYESYHFSQERQKKLFYEVIQKTRCVICQSQSIADSNALIASDLRNKIYHLVKENKNEQEINSYLIKRYGDFILLEPQLKKTTLLLWTFPFLVLLTGLILLYKFIKQTD